MTTTVIVKTHDWPVAVDISDQHNFSTPLRTGWGHSSSTEFVGAHSEAEYHVTDTRSVSFRELPKGAKSLADDPQNMANQAVGAPTSVNAAPVCDEVAGDGA